MRSQPPEKAGLQFFLSFDLEGSTAYKAAAADWPWVFRRFYDAARSAVVRRLPSARIWKYVGDEVLLRLAVTSVKELEEALAGTFDASNDTTKELHRAFPGTRGRLAVKATCWMALVEPADGKGGPSGARNLALTLEGPDARAQEDYLGPDIDIGFRIARFAERNVLTVSADVAWVLRRAGTARMTERLRVVTYEQLKGVWGDRYYPIVWYHPRWSSLKRLFRYDDEFRSATVRRGLRREVRPVEELERVYGELGLDALGASLLQRLGAADKGPARRARARGPAGG